MKIEHMAGWTAEHSRHCLMHAGGHTFILERWRDGLAWIWIAPGYLDQKEMGVVSMSEVYDVDQNGGAKEWLAAKIAEIRARKWAGVE